MQQTQQTLHSNIIFLLFLLNADLVVRDKSFFVARNRASFSYIICYLFRSLAGLLAKDPMGYDAMVGNWELGIRVRGVVTSHESKRQRTTETEMSSCFKRSSYINFDRRRWRRPWANNIIMMRSTITPSSFFGYRQSLSCRFGRTDSGRPSKKLDCCNASIWPATQYTRLQVAQ